MGKVEEKARKVRRVGQTQRIVLATIATLGVASVAVMAPNALKMFKPLLNNKNRLDERLKAASNRLVRDGYLKRTHTEGGKVLEITQKGEDILERINVQKQAEELVRKSERWDGRWRIVVYDIPEKKKKKRDQLRYVLTSSGFRKIQNSVWVFPYECEELIELVKTDLEMGREVLYAVAEQIEGDAKMRKHFNLPLNF